MTYNRDPELIPADEYDALQISEWLEYRAYLPLRPASARWDDFEWADQNPDAWPMVTLPPGMSVAEAKATMANFAKD